MGLTEDIEAWFTFPGAPYHAPTPEQLPKYIAVRDFAKGMAHCIEQNVPRCADQSAAFRLLRECVMTANAAIALEGK